MKTRPGKVTCKCGKPAMVGEPRNQCWECIAKEKPEVMPSPEWQAIFDKKGKAKCTPTKT